MAEIHFKAYLAGSFSEKDKEVIEFFKRIISSFGIEPIMYNYQEIGRLSEKMKEKIIEYDCFIAILTKHHKIEGTGDWKCSDWIQHELPLAMAFQKPIAIFVEEGVKIDGLIEKEEEKNLTGRNF